LLTEGEFFFEIENAAADAGHFCVYLDHVYSRYSVISVIAVIPFIPFWCFQFVLLRLNGWFQVPTNGARLSVSGTDSSISILD